MKLYVGVTYMQSSLDETDERGSTVVRRSSELHGPFDSNAALNEWMSDFEQKVRRLEMGNKYNFGYVYMELNDGELVPYKAEKDKGDWHPCIIHLEHGGSLRDSMNRSWGGKTTKDLQPGDEILVPYRDHRKWEKVARVEREQLFWGDDPL